MLDKSLLQFYHTPEILHLFPITKIPCLVLVFMHLLLCSSKRKRWVFLIRVLLILALTFQISIYDSLMNLCKLHSSPWLPPFRLSWVALGSLLIFNLLRQKLCLGSFKFFFFFFYHYQFITWISCVSCRITLVEEMLLTLMLDSYSMYVNSLLLSSLRTQNIFSPLLKMLKFWTKLRYPVEAMSKAEFRNSNSEWNQHRLLCIYHFRWWQVMETLLVDLSEQ